MKILAILALILGLFVAVCAQDKPQPDRWRGLVLNEATSADALKLLGKPDEEKTNRLFAYGIDERRLTPKIKEKAYRHLVWKKQAGFKLIQMAFRDDRLLTIYLWLDKEHEFPAASLEAAYGLPFEPKQSTLSELSNGPIGGSPLSGRRNVPYPDVYHLFAQTEAAWVQATIDNGGWRHRVLGDGDTSRATGSYPGKVGAVALVSRSLENRDAGSILK